MIPRGFKQSIVERYSARMKWIRPLYNALSSFSGRPKLPRAGIPFDYVVAAIPVALHDDPAVFEALSRAARAQAAAARAGHLLIGCHEDDPFVSILRSQSVAFYATRLYYVCWDDGDRLRLTLDNRTPYLELGTL